MLQDLWNEREEIMAEIAAHEARHDPGDVDDLVGRLYDGPERAI